MIALVVTQKAVKVIAKTEIEVILTYLYILPAILGVMLVIFFLYSYSSVFKIFSIFYFSEFKQNTC